ncbi:MAG TPA: hypothetical protein VLT37_07790 [Acidocella sp.]|nr:hypothetical protein [Acidocella sp.]
MTLLIRAEPYDWPHDGSLHGSLRPESTALVIIDVQRDFTDSQGYGAPRARLGDCA